MSWTIETALSYIQLRGWTLCELSCDETTTLAAILLAIAEAEDKSPRSLAAKVAE